VARSIIALSTSNQAVFPHLHRARPAQSTNFARGKDGIDGEECFYSARARSITELTKAAGLNAAYLTTGWEHPLATCRVCRYFCFISIACVNLIISDSFAEWVLPDPLFFMLIILLVPFGFRVRGTEAHLVAGGTYDFLLLSDVRRLGIHPATNRRGLSSGCLRQAHDVTAFQSPKNKMCVKIIKGRLHRSKNLFRRIHRVSGGIPGGETNVGTTNGEWASAQVQHGRSRRNSSTVPTVLREIRFLPRRRWGETGKASDRYSLPDRMHGVELHSILPVPAARTLRGITDGTAHQEAGCKLGIRSNNRR